MYRSIFESLFIHGLKAEQTPALRAQLKALGVDLDKLLPGYEYPVWERAALAALSCFPQLSRGEGLMLLGRRTVAGSLEVNPLSRAGLKVLSLLGVTRAMKRAFGKDPSQTVSRATFGAESPTSLEVTFSQVGTIPEFSLGSLLEVAETLGARDAQGHLVAHHDDGRAQYELAWR
jgi:uncharacterized protein (TIGR02265 family)